MKMLHPHVDRKVPTHNHHIQILSHFPQANPPTKFQSTETQVNLKFETICYIQ
jgi:hypothetical protein